MCTKYIFFLLSLVVTCIWTIDANAQQAGKELHIGGDGAKAGKDVSVGKEIHVGGAKAGKDNDKAATSTSSGGGTRRNNTIENPSESGMNSKNGSKTVFNKLKDKLENDARNKAEAGSASASTKQSNQSAIPASTPGRALQPPNTSLNKSTTPSSVKFPEKKSK